MRILEGFLLGSTTQAAQGKALREVWWDWRWPHRFWDLKVFQRRHYQKKFRRIKCALFGLAAHSHMLRAEERFCCQLLLFMSPICLSLWRCSWASAAEEPGIKRKNLLNCYSLFPVKGEEGTATTIRFNPLNERRCNNPHTARKLLSFSLWWLF